jgi:putative membrane protein
MNVKKILSTSALVCIFGATSSLAFAVDKIDADDFVDEVSAKGIAEVESAKVALEKSSSADVRSFAQKMITDHSAANLKLAGIARQKKLEVSTEAELTTKAKNSFWNNAMVNPLMRLMRIIRFQHMKKPSSYSNKPQYRMMQK